MVNQRIDSFCQKREYFDGYFQAQFLEFYIKI